MIYFYFGEHGSEKDVDGKFIELLKKADIFVFENGLKKFNTDLEKCFGPEDPLNLKISLPDPFETQLYNALIQYNKHMTYFENAPNPEEVCFYTYDLPSKLNEESGLPAIKLFVSESVKAILHKRDICFLKQIQNLSKEHPDKTIITHRGIMHLPFFERLISGDIKVEISDAKEIRSWKNEFFIEHYKRELGRPHAMYTDNDYLQLVRMPLIF